MPDGIFTDPEVFRDFLVGMEYRLPRPSREMKRIEPSRATTFLRNHSSLKPTELIIGEGQRSSSAVVVVFESGGKLS
jgi:hypothetical protein